MVGVVRVLQRLVLAVALLLLAGGVAGPLAAERLQHAQPQQQQQQPRHGAALQHCSHHITISAESHCSPGHRSLLPAATSWSEHSETELTLQLYVFIYTCLHIIYIFTQICAAHNITVRVTVLCRHRCSLFTHTVHVKYLYVFIYLSWFIIFSFIHHIKFILCGSFYAWDTVSNNPTSAEATTDHSSATFSQTPVMRGTVPM